MIFKKQLNWMKNNKRTLITGVICLVVGSAIGASDSLELEKQVTIYKTKYESTKKENETLAKDIKNSNTKVNLLEDKIKGADVWFNMDEEKRKVVAESETAALLAQKEENEKKEREAKEANAKAEAEAKEASAKAEAEAKQAALDAKSKTLSNGKYQAGTDFEPGKYNIIAVKGGGNVMCPAAGLNAIMGVNKSASVADMYQKEYKNITFKSGHILDIRNVTINLVPVS